MSWEIYLTDEVNDWLDGLLKHDTDSHRQVVSADRKIAGEWTRDSFQA